ncbi:MAG TPA: HAMP domain-containing sensor histidine kinase [Candidatus Eisenbacteria bacterium]|nr:HAMP domain-containing sensor histidine kinase [Candidatus Eisenbacteria bacterium]
MFRSLRARLLLLVAVVAGLSLAAAALLSRQAVRTEFLRLETSERAARLGDAAAMLDTWLRRTGSLAGADSVLKRLRPPGARGSGGLVGAEFLLIAPDGTVLAASAPEYRAASVELRQDGGLGITVPRREGNLVRVRREVLVGGPRAEIHGPDGAVRATLYRLPAIRPEAIPSPFIVSVNRWLLLAALISGALAILLTLALSRRILGPVEALTGAVRRMERGDLTARVPVRSSDEIAELSSAFNRMAASLEENEASRRRLLGDVAHELRSPLTNLRCQIEAVEDGLATADAETMRSLHEETLLLGRLVDDIQDLALAEAGRLPLHRERVSPRAALEAAAAAFTPLAADRGVSLRAGGEGAPDVDADPARLKQVLRNLVANALAHTPEGGTVELDASSGGDGRVAFTVRDTGAGIAPEDLPHIFDRFYRADRARTRETGGSGLGLSIVKQLVEAHGGSVAAESRPGAGTTVRFTLPQAPPS